MPGTAEINCWGGYEKQYQVRIDPRGLIKHDLTFDQVVQAVRDNNLNVGGGYLNRSGQRLLVSGAGRTHDLEQIRNIVVTAKEGVPIRVGDVAEVEIGHDLPPGGVTADGGGTIVLGLGFMLMGENGHDVTSRLKEKLEQVKTNFAGRRPGRNALRPHGAGRPRHRHGAQQPVRGRPAGGRRAVPLPGQPAGRV